MYKRAMNLRISVYFHQIVLIRYYLMKIPGLTSLPLSLRAKKVHEDNIFDRQDTIQFFSEVSKDYKYVKCG